jgi:hypothetical protein
MRSSVQLDIPIPCYESWEQMTPAGQGRFCGSCRQIVVDFTNFSDQELVRYFQEYKGSVCGQFNPYQLRTDLYGAAPVKRNWLPAALFSTAAVLLTGSAKAADSTVAPIAGKPAVEMVVPDTVAITGTVKGRLRGEPMQEVCIFIKEVNRSVKTAEDGSFSIHIPLADVIDGFTLEFATLRDKEEVRLQLTDRLQGIQLEMKDYPGVTIFGYGAVKGKLVLTATPHVSKVKTARKRFFQFFKSLF